MRFLGDHRLPGATSEHSFDEIRADVMPVLGVLH
jgi:hypothetical protein